MTYTQIKRYGAQVKRGAVLVPLAVAGGAANAALPAGVTDAIATAGADLLTAGTAVVVAMIAFWAVKKVGTKMGFW